MERIEVIEKSNGAAMATAEETINWVHEFGINEQLHSTAQAISAAYSLLFFDNANHPDSAKWNQQAFDWFYYNKNIEKVLVFETKEEGEAEVLRVSIALQEVKNIKLANKKKA
jgi:hypothetical protein